MNLLSRLDRFVLTTLLALVVLPCQAVSLDGLNLGQYRGKVVLLDFWASWCAPCLESFPWMQQIQQKYSERGLVVIGVNVDHERRAAERFLQAQQASFPIFFDPNGQLAEHFHVSNMPSSFYIDRKGNIRYTHPGFRDSERSDAEREIAALLSEQP